MGGRGGSVNSGRAGRGSSGIASAAAIPTASVITGEVTERLLSPEQILKDSKAIDRKGFVDQGFGQWTFDGPYTIGAQILDETDSAEGGFGRYKTYSMRTWGQHVEDTGAVRYFSRLSDAKVAAKEEMKEWLKSVTRSGR